jgi:hypothetical protein
VHCALVDVSQSTSVNPAGRLLCTVTDGTSIGPLLPTWCTIVTFDPASTAVISSSVAGFRTELAVAAETLPVTPKSTKRDIVGSTDRGIGAPAADVPTVVTGPTAPTIRMFPKPAPVDP